MSEQTVNIVVAAVSGLIAMIGSLGGSWYLFRSKLAELKVTAEKARMEQEAEEKQADIDNAAHEAEIMASIRAEIFDQLRQENRRLQEERAADLARINELERKVLQIQTESLINTKIERERGDKLESELEVERRKRVELERKVKHLQQENVLLKQEIEDLKGKDGC